MRILFDFLKSNYQRTWFGFAVAFLMSALTVALPIWLGGIRQTFDMESHIHFAQAFREGILAGDLYPNWANDNLGFGSVGVRFYPPISAFTSAVFALATGDLHSAFVLSIFLWMLVGCFGMYLFVREWSSTAPGLLAGILYAVVPYHIAHIYRFFLYAEFAAMAAVPFCLLYLTRLCRRGKWADLVPLATSWSFLILTHVPVTLMMAFSMIVYIPIAVDRRRWKKVILQLTCSAALIAGATSYYWIRVVTELAWVAHSEERYTVAGYERGPMLFPYLLENYDIKYEAPFLRHLDIVTILTIGLLIPSVLVLIGWRKNLPIFSRRVIAAASCSAAFGIFMFSKPSGFLWSGLNILQRLQYPWRWLAVVSAFAVVSFSLSIAVLTETRLVSRATAVVGSIFLVSVFAAIDIKQIRGTAYRISSQELNKLSTDVQSQRVAEHWWPTWAKADAFQGIQPVASEHERKVDIIEWRSEQRRFMIGDGESENLRVATFYYPYWRATVNGREVEVGRDASGVMTVPVGREPAEVAIAFKEPLVNTIAAWLSLACWAFLVASLTYRLGPLRRKISRGGKT